MRIEVDNVDNRLYKERFIDALYSREANIYPPKKRGNSYVVRCPYCGDSSDPRKAHFYITINLDDNSPILYNCFRCPVGGYMTREVMERLEIADPTLQDGIRLLNRTSDRYDKKQVNEESTILFFDYQLPEVKESPKLDYIRNRLGVDFTTEDFQEMKVITSLKEFLLLNNVKKITCENWVAHMLENQYVGFLSHGSSYIFFRDITGTSEFPWVKYPITEKSRESKSFYSLSAQLDIFTEDEIVVNLSEGVFDILGVRYHISKKETNVVNIAVTGKYYESVVYYLISIGLVGSNVTINFFSDNDEKFNKKRKGKSEDTSIEHYRKIFGKMKYLFKSINVYYNEIGKDVGVTKDKISLIKHKL